MDFRIYTKINGKEKRIISIHEAGNILKITRQAILKKINKGELRAVRYSGLGQDKFYFVFYDEIKKLKRR